MARTMAISRASVGPRTQAASRLRRLERGLLLRFRAMVMIGRRQLHTGLTGWIQAVSGAWQVHPDSRSNDLVRVSSALRHWVASVTPSEQYCYGVCDTSRNTCLVGMFLSECACVFDRAQALSSGHKKALPSCEGRALQLNSAR